MPPQDEPPGVKKRTGGSHFAQDEPPYREMQNVGNMLHVFLDDIIHTGDVKFLAKK